MMNIPEPDEIPLELFLAMSDKPTVELLQSAGVPYIFYPKYDASTSQRQIGDVMMEDSIFHRVEDADLPVQCYASMDFDELYLDYCGKLYILYDDGSVKQIQSWENDVKGQKE